MKLTMAATGLTLILLSGCCTTPTQTQKVTTTSTAPKPPSVLAALQAIEINLHDAAPVTVGDFDPGASDSEIQTASKTLTLEVQKGQCSQNTPNPLIPAISGPFSLALEGALTWGPTASVTAGTTGISGTWQYAVSNNQQQQVTIPIQFVSALDLPYFYFSQQVSEVTSLDSKEKQKAILALERSADEIKKAVSLAMNSYPLSAAACKKLGLPNIVEPMERNLLSH